MLLGLVHPDAGSGSFDGRRYEELPHPSSQVGAVLEDASFHPARSGRNHLRVLAAAGRHPAERLLAAPDRVRFLAAKTLAFAAAGVGLSLLISVSVAVVCDPCAARRRECPKPGRLWR